MSLRGKLFAAMFALILFMTGVFFVLSRTYMGSLFGQYTSVVRSSAAQQWSSVLAQYYRANHRSWANVDAYIDQVEQSRPSLGTWASHEALLIEDGNKNTIYITSSKRETKSEILRIGYPVPIVDHGKRVATVYVLDVGLARLFHLQAGILATMTKVTVYGAIATMGVALLLALWISRLLTNPLNQMVGAIREMAKGNLRQRLPIDTSDEFGQVAAAFNQLSKQLSTVEEARRHLVADVAHELRTPLTIIQGQLELVQQGVLKPDMETLLPISDECIRLSRLVGDLHQLSQAEAGVLTLERQNTDIISLLERIVDNFQFEAEDRQIRLTLEVKPQQVWAYVDSSRITQVFINLIGNALRYVPVGGVVMVRIFQRLKDVEIRVADSGPGIAPDHLPNLFNRFYRVDQDRNRAGGGMGLGLAIAKEFVEAHGGRIDVHSVVGEGTTFTVTLPMHA